jgi:Holliday junction resolvase RusA-like endonuclease
MINFFVYGTPVPQGSSTAFVHNGKAIITSANRNLKGWRVKIRGAAFVANARRTAQEAPGGEFPVPGYYMVRLSFWMPRPAFHYGAKGLKASAPAFPAVKPDLDKLVRAILDGITDAKVWGDDSQVIGIMAVKMYAPTPEAVGVGVEIFETNNPNVLDWGHSA